MNYAQRTGKLPSWLAEAAMRSGDFRKGKAMDLLVFQNLMAGLKLTKTEAAAVATIQKKWNERTPRQ